MFDKIFEAFKNDTGLAHITSVVNALNQVVAHFHDDYVKDGNVRDAAFDAIGDLFKGMKSANPPA